MANNKNITFLTIISKLLYPNHHPFWFLFYMYGLYYKINKRRVTYKFKPALIEIINKHCNKYKDLNSCVLVNESNLLKCDKWLKLTTNNDNNTRIVSVIPVNNLENDVLLGSNVLLSNLLKNSIDNINEFKLKSIKEHNIKFASEVELSLISSSFEISNAVVDTLIENYFSTPKIIYKGDIIEINLKLFGEKMYYLNTKINNVCNVYFKCKRVIFDNKEVTSGFFCVIGETAVKQSINFQSFLPKKVSEVVNYKNNIVEVPFCPYGLQEDFDNLKKSVKPFLGKRKLNVNPVFLVQGNKGVGKEILLESLALFFGLNIYKINNLDLSANIYAQNEQKIKNTFFSAKLSAPCIITILNFENFGKNNEGQFDERIISYFSNELNSLFENNVFPILLFCCSNEKNIPSELQRIFLETFTISSPNDVQRKDLLKWIMDKNKINYKVNLDHVANKTHGFLFEDLKALVYFSKNNAGYNEKTDCDKEILKNEDVIKAIDYMQSNYNKSLGAPKVPKVKWSDVGGLSEVKDEIIKTINLPLKHPELLKNSGLKRSGILLFGPPGTGKTLIAKAVATECSLCFLSVKGPELLNMYVGQSEKNVREVFERAREASPCIIFFDELDSLAPNRGMSGDSGGVMDRVVSQLLAEMDGLNEIATIFIIGATNRPDLVDPALLRPGRFDKLLYIGPCTDPISKLSVLTALTRKFNFSKDVDLEKIVKQCPVNITGADFYGICSNAWSAAVRRLIQKNKNSTMEHITHKDVLVGEQDFKTAIENVKPSINNEDLKYFEKLKKELGSNC
ncbi:unnamed protein product [Brassicogethes aeneus]|uniref:Peroxisomal ATPase PEX6 n=1 Tax=Brassicogethes aeneus TaxID=1431903 RepID=A0A9P0ASY1_BRAAE|nr:unnamed protein product [Brassicogethes aeneus]